MLVTSTYLPSPGILKNFQNSEEHNADEQIEEEMKHGEDRDGDEDEDEDEDVQAENEEEDREDMRNSQKNQYALKRLYHQPVIFQKLQRNLREAISMPECTPQDIPRKIKLLGMLKELLEMDIAEQVSALMYHRFLYCFPPLNCRIFPLLTLKPFTYKVCKPSF